MLVFKYLCCLVILTNFALILSKKEKKKKYSANENYKLGETGEFDHYFKDKSPEEIQKSFITRDEYEESLLPEDKKIKRREERLVKEEKEKQFEEERRKLKKEQEKRKKQEREKLKEEEKIEKLKETEMVDIEDLSEEELEDIEYADKVMEDLGILDSKNAPRELFRVFLERIMIRDENDMQVIKLMNRLIDRIMQTTKSPIDMTRYEDYLDEDKINVLFEELQKDEEKRMMDEAREDVYKQKEKDKEKELMIEKTIVEETAENTDNKEDYEIKVDL